jgi:hypothetical protein
MLTICSEGTLKSGKGNIDRANPFQFFYQSFENKNLHIPKAHIVQAHNLRTKAELFANARK